MAARRTLAALAAVALSAPVANAPATGDPGPGGFMSPNVTWHATVPIDIPGIGAEVVTVGKQRRFYVTGLRGLSIYDVTIPTVPIPLGHLELPHFENEAVAASRDGSVAIITSDLQPQTFVIDTTIPQVPRLASVIPRGSHTATCSDAKCQFLYASEGWSYDIRDRAKPKPAGTWGGGGHAANLDDAGFVVADGGLQMFDPRRNPAKPRKVSSGLLGGKASWGHNNIRPDATRWRPRRAGDNSRALRPGELLLSGGETLVTGKCPGGSGISSWSMANFDRGQRFRPIDTFFPKSGNYVDGNPAVNAAGCSSHWFDYRNGVVAAGWYENGIRFFDIHKTTGKISEVGWFQPVATEAWAAYWIDDKTVYSLDAARGIDVLTLDRDGARPTATQLAASWHVPANRPLSFVTQRERMVCSMAQRRSMTD